MNEGENQEEAKQSGNSDKINATKPDEEVKRKKKKFVLETDLITEELQQKWFNADNQLDQEVQLVFKGEFENFESVDSLIDKNALLKNK